MTNLPKHRFIRIYITGYGRSGSSALDKLISANFNFVGLGEVKYLHNSTFQGNRCSCGISVTNCHFWKHSPDYWSFHFKKYIILKNLIGVVDSSKTTFDSINHFRKALNDPDTKFIEIQRPYVKVMKSIWRGANNKSHTDYIHIKILRVTRASVNLLWTRLLYLIILRRKSLFVSQKTLRENPKEVVKKISYYLNVPLDRDEQIEHQVAGNRLFHKL